MVIEVADNLKWESPTIFYSQDQDIILWQSFKSHGFIQPRFVKIPEFPSDQQLLKILLNVKHKRVSATLNIILFVHQWHITEKFIQSIISNFSHIIYIFRIFLELSLSDWSAIVQTWAAWKFQEFSTTQILREINFGHFEVP